MEPTIAMTSPEQTSNDPLQITNGCNSAGTAYQHPSWLTANNKTKILRQLLKCHNANGNRLNTYLYGNTSIEHILQLEAKKSRNATKIPMDVLNYRNYKYRVERELNTNIFVHKNKDLFNKIPNISDSPHIATRNVIENEQNLLI